MNSMRNFTQTCLQYLQSISCLNGDWGDGGDVGDEGDGGDGGGGGVCRDHRIDEQDLHDMQEAGRYSQEAENMKQPSWTWMKFFSFW